MVIIVVSVQFYKMCYYKKIMLKYIYMFEANIVHWPLNCSILASFEIGTYRSSFLMLLALSFDHLPGAILVELGREVA